VHADIGLQVALRTDHRDLEAMAALGAVSFELFTAEVPASYRHHDAARLNAAVAAVGATGVLAAVSPGDHGLLTAAQARLTPGRSSAAEFVASRPPAAEANGIARAVLAAAVTGARVHIRQSNTAFGLATFRRLRDLADVSIETTPQCLILTSDDYERLGPLAKASPPLRPPADRDALRAALADGVIDVVATDHAPHTEAEKMAAAHDFANVSGGFPGVQTLLPTLLSLVDERLIALPDLVRVAATRPAERFGLRGRKGRLAVGHDADILVVDPREPSAVRNADQIAKVRATPFDGLRVSFALKRVLLRGVAVGATDGAPMGQVLGGRE
jgi:dihydroorotase